LPKIVLQKTIYSHLPCINSSVNQCPWLTIVIAPYIYFLYSPMNKKYVDTQPLKHI
jgi:hypothetical protein